MSVIRTQDEKVNPVCAISSVFAALVLVLIFFTIAAVIVISLGISTQGWPRLPHVVGWVCDAWVVGWVAFKLYPKCMKARIARRLSHG